MSKYSPLHQRLVRGTAVVELSFDDIAELVGGLPPSAFTSRQWWANSAGRHVQANAWLDAGRTVEAVDLVGRRVCFSGREH